MMTLYSPKDELLLKIKMFIGDSSLSKHMMTVYSPKDEDEKKKKVVTLI